jgi:predicted nucleic acid-binding Zn ribbon protein
VPRYDFICDECGSTKTLTRKIADQIADRNEPVFCLLHGGDADSATFNAPLMRRVVGAGGFSLKGEGWYADGYAKKTPS